MWPSVASTSKPVRSTRADGSATSIVSNVQRSVMVGSPAVSLLVFGTYPQDAPVHLRTRPCSPRARGAPRRGCRHRGGGPLRDQAPRRCRSRRGQGGTALRRPAPTLDRRRRGATARRGLGPLPLPQHLEALGGGG